MKKKNDDQHAKKAGGSAEDSNEQEKQAGDGSVDKEQVIEDTQNSSQPIDPKDAKISELTALVKQVQADFINYKNRVEREKSEQIKMASKGVLMKMLNVADNFELSLKHTSNHEEFVKGVEFIYSQLIQVLEEEGVKRIDAQGKFDPYRHEALLSEESEKESGTVLEVIQNGYTLNGKVVRNAKVKVAK